MSITFHTTQIPDGYRLGCAFSPTRYDERDAALAALTRHHVDGCGYPQWAADNPGADAEAAFERNHPLGWEPDRCDGYVGIEPVYNDPGPELNLSNVNAATVFYALGITGDDRYVGMLTADEMLGRVLIADGLAPSDAGTDTLAYVSHNADGQADVGLDNVRWLAFGREPDYLQQRLGQLHEMATWAIAHGLDIAWS